MPLERRLLDDRDSRSRVTGQIYRQLTGNWVDFLLNEAYTMRLPIYVPEYVPYFFCRDFPVAVSARPRDASLTLSRSVIHDVFSYGLPGESRRIHASEILCQDTKGIGCPKSNTVADGLI